MSARICKSYPLAALLINAAGEEVTEKRIKTVFDALDLEFSSKKASMFCLPADKITTMMYSTGSSQSGAPAASGSPAAEATNENVPEDEASSDDESFDLGF